MKKYIIVLGFLTGFTITAIAGNCLEGNCYSGSGIYHFDSGGTYDGSFRNGKMHGQGSYRSNSGNKYEGNWYYGRRQGNGVMHFSNGDVYRGDFKDDRLEGYGKITYRNGDHYTGDWKNNKAHGNGKYVFHDGDRYTGKFVAGKFHGKGIMKYADGAYYNGYWASNKKHGSGTLIASNGKKQQGNWSYGKYRKAQSQNNYAQDHRPHKRQSGFTTSQVSSNAASVQSRTSSNKQGTYTFSDGTEYVGQMLNGLPNGQGKVYFKNGDRYEGGWKHHTQHGKGTMVYVNGRRLQGEWNSGRLIKAYHDSYEDINKANALYGEVKVWAVLVGISSYSTMPALKYTDDDAYRMYAFLKSPEGGAVPDDQIRILIDQGANKKQILSTVNEIFSKADPNDVVMFYYSGHGLSDAFVPVDFDGYNNLLHYKDVVAALDRSKAKNKICIADACYAGGIDNVKSGVRQPQLAYYDAFKKSKPGTALFLSSRKEEYSLEDHGLRSGIFSHYLIKALKGDADRNSNGIVTIQEAFDYVGNRVKTYTQYKQSPILTGNYDPNIPLASLR